VIAHGVDGLCKFTTKRWYRSWPWLAGAGHLARKFAKKLPNLAINAEFTPQWIHPPFVGHPGMFQSVNVIQFTIASINELRVKSVPRIIRTDPCFHSRRVAFLETGFSFRVNPLSRQPRVRAINFVVS
jgi:hypothetical protein